MPNPFAEPQRPRLALRVGVTGHRPGSRLAEERMPAAAAEIRSILERLQAAVDGTREGHARCFAPGGADLRLVSALAEGADRIAAHAALGCGWVLETILPFRSGQYRTDFESDASQREFDGLVESSAGVFCLAMDADAERRPRGYEAAGLVMLDNADMLIAVWDGEPARGRGGTAEIVMEALERGMPVLHVDAAGGAPARLLRGMRDGVPLGKKTLDALVGGLLTPPADQAALERFFGEAGARGARRDGRLLGWWRFTRRFAAVAAAFGPAHGLEGRAAPSPLAPSPAAPGEGQRMLQARYEAADAISTHLGHVYRSAFILVFLSSACAVLSGLLAVFWWDELGAKALFVCVELGFIAVLLRLTRVGGARAWHRRWLDTRRLAELLRMAAAQAPLGGATSLAPVDDDEAEGAWTEWYARASLREARLPSIVADGPELVATAHRFVAGFVDGQIAYHLAAARRLHAQHEGLDRIGLALFWATIVTGALFLAAAAGFYVAGVHDGPVYDMFKAWIKPLVTLCSAGFPALGAALYGIRAQGDYQASATRSAATGQALLKVRARILAACAAPDFIMLRDRFAEAAEIMQSDLSDWRQIYRHRPIAIPA